jgi:5-methylcytosine-specific restriction endonuclease McrA
MINTKARRIILDVSSVRKFITMMMQQMKTVGCVDSVSVNTPEQIAYAILGKSKVIKPKSKCTYWCREQRIKLLEMHGHKCRICGSQHKLCFHHIVPLTENDHGRGMQKRYKDYKEHSSIIALVCKGCHKKIQNVMLI